MPLVSVDEEEFFFSVREGRENNINGEHVKIKTVVKFLTNFEQKSEITDEKTDE